MSKEVRKDTPPMIDTSFLLKYLEANSDIVDLYLRKCLKENKQPSCTSFVRYVGFEWSDFKFSRREITEYLKERIQVVKNGEITMD